LNSGYPAPNADAIYNYNKTPGVSPIFNNNPGFKKVYYNGDYAPIDFTTHYTSRINDVWGVNNITWGDSIYTFSDYYGAGTMIKQTLSGYLTNDLYYKVIKNYMVRSPISSGSEDIKQGITMK